VEVAAAKEPENEPQGDKERKGVRGFPEPERHLVRSGEGGTCPRGAKKRLHFRYYGKYSPQPRGALLS